MKSSLRSASIGIISALSPIKSRLLWELLSCNRRLAVSISVESGSVTTDRGVGTPDCVNSGGVTNMGVIAWLLSGFVTTGHGVEGVEEIVALRSISAILIALSATVDCGVTTERVSGCGV